MPRTISPLMIRIQASGARQVKQDVREVAGSFEVVVQAGARADSAMKGAANSAKSLVLAGRGADQIAQAFDKAGNAAGSAAKNVTDMGREVKNAEKDTKSLADRMFEADKRAGNFAGNVKQLGGHLKTVAGHAQQVHGIWKALSSGSPLKLFDTVVPQHVKTKVGLGMMASGGGILGGLATTVAPAAEKQQQMTAITALAGNRRDVAEDIYKVTDEASIVSAYGLPELVDAAKTLTKDRQFSKRFLRAIDDLAATDPGKFKPQDAARALGRIRSGQSGEGLERLSEMGLNRLDLEAKGVKFDGQGALDDKSAAGITRTINTIVTIIEERFGGLSEKLATTTLSGSITNMQDAIGRFSTSLGETFIPALNWGANTIQAFATWMNSLSPATKSAIAWGTALTGTLLIAGGAFLIVGGAIAKAVFAYQALNWALGLFGMSVRTASLALIQQMIPSLAMIGLGVLAIAGIAWGLKTAIQGTADAQKQSDAQLEYSWGIMGKVWIGISGFMNAVWNHPLLSWIHGNTKQKGDSAEDESRKIINASLKRRGIKAITKADQDAVGGPEETVADVRKREEAKAKGGAALKDWQKQQAAIFGKMGAGSSAGGGAMPFMGGGKFSRSGAEQTLFDEQSPDVQAAQEKVDSIVAELDNLSEQRRNTDDKALKKTLGDQIFARQRLLRAARRELAAIKKLATRKEREAARAEKAQERREDKVGDIDFDIAKSVVEDKHASLLDGYERQLRAAKDSGDGARLKRITFDIGSEKARQQLEIDLLSADREKDATVRSALRRKAQNAFRVARNTAARDAKNAELDAREEQQDVIRKGDVDAKKAEGQNETDARIAPLQEQLEAAEEAKNFSLIRSLTLQIESAKAMQEYADAMADATLEENAEKRRQLERLASIRKNGALAKAGFAADKAVRSAKKDKDGASDKGAREALARMNRATRGGGLGASGTPLAAMNGLSMSQREEARRREDAFNRGEGGSFADEPYRLGGRMVDGVPSLANFGGDTMNLKRERMVKIQSMTQNGQGDTRVQFEPIDIGYQGIANVEVN